VVDGLLGMGLERDVELPFATIITGINRCAAPVLAIDVPSGLDAATGRIRGGAVRATRTITFIAHKVGLHTGDGLDCRGELVLDADELNAIAYNEMLQRALAAGRGPTILTPHPAEAARLLGRETVDVQAHRLESALEIASRLHAHVVLKGAGSICAFPGGR